MEIKEPSCQICFNKYDSDTHCPRILPHCGHTLCTMCLLHLFDSPNRQLICPFDKKKYAIPKCDLIHFPKNFSLLQIIEDKLSEIVDCCQEHKKKFDCVCLDCRETICPGCAAANHIGHKVESKQQVILQINSKVDRMDELIGLVDNHPNKVFKKVESLLEARENNLKRSVEAKFAEYQNLLLNKKQEVLNAITHNFSLQRKNIHEKYTRLDEESTLMNVVLTWKEQAKKKINNWRALSANDIAYEIHEEQVELVGPQIEEWKNQIESKIDIKELSSRLDKIDVEFDEENLPQAIAKICTVKNNNVDEETKQDKNEIIELQEIIMESSNSNKASIKSAPLKIDIKDEKQEEQRIKEISYIEKKVKEAKKLLRKMLMASDLQVEWAKNSYDTIHLKEEVFEDFFCVCVCLTPWNKKCLQYLKSINIICEKFNDKLTKGLSGSLTNLTNLNHLRIEFKRDFAASEITDLGLIKLSESIAKLVYLHDLELDFKSCEKISDNGIIKLGSNLCKLTTLDRFQITFSKNGVYTDDGITKFGQSLAKMNNLNQLEVEFLNNKYISNDGIPSLINSVSKLPSLHNIRLSLIELDSFNDSGFNQLGQHLSSMYNLKRLRLDMTLKSDTVVSQLAQMISKLINLQALQLNMENMNRVTINGMNQLYYSLSKLEYLNHLHLTFRHWWTIHASITNLEQTLSKLRGLKELHLELIDSWCLKDEEMIHFSQILSRCTSLTQFSIKHDHGLTDRGITTLSGALSLLFHLTYLKFDFIGCTEISDTALSKISTAISRMPELSHFELHFKSCPHITDNGISQISHAISQKTKINTLVLEFGDCVNITDKGFSQLCKSFSSLPCLSCVRFIFNGCWKVTNEGLGTITSMIPKISGLNHIYLDLTNCQRITDDAKQGIQKAVTTASKTKSLFSDIRV